MSRTAKIVLAVALTAVVAAAIWLPAGEWLRDLVAWVRGLGVVGLVVFSAVFIAVCMVLLPSVELYLAAGMLYGTVWGALLVTALGVVVEMLTLVVVHSRLRRSIETRIAKHPKIAALDRGFSERSLWILLLLRFSPVIPFGLLNYALAMTKAPLWKRLVANFLGMLPCSLMIAYVGSFLTGSAQLRSASAPALWKHFALGAGVVATIVAGVLAARASKRVLARESH